MIEIKPNILYTRADLAALLESSGVDVDNFIGRLKPRKVFRHLFFGKDLLHALESAPGLNDESAEGKPSARKTRSSAGSARVYEVPGSRLRAASRSGKGEKS